MVIGCEMNKIFEVSEGWGPSEGWVGHSIYDVPHDNVFGGATSVACNLIFVRNGLPNTPLFGCCSVKPLFFFWLVLRATTPFSFFTERALTANEESLDHLKKS